MLTLDECLELFTAGVADPALRLPAVPQVDLARGVSDLMEASLGRWGIQPRRHVLLGTPRWEIPPGADDAPPGSVVHLRYDATFRVLPNELVEGSPVARAKKHTPLWGLAVREELELRYTGVAFARGHDGSWLYYGESGDTMPWNYLVSCPHGGPVGIHSAGVAFTVLGSFLTDNDHVMHYLFVQNNASGRVTVVTHGVGHRKPGDKLAMPPLGFDLPPGGDLVVPVAAPRGSVTYTLALVGPGEVRATCLALPVAPVAGHPGGTSGWCPGATYFERSLVPAGAASEWLPATPTATRADMSDLLQVHFPLPDDLGSRRARKLVDRTREQVAKAVGVGGRVEEVRIEDGHAVVRVRGHSATAMFNSLRAQLPRLALRPSYAEIGAVGEPTLVQLN